MHCRPETKSKVCQKIAQSGFESEKEEDNFQPSNKRHTKSSSKIKQGTEAISLEDYFKEVCSENTENT